MALSDDMPYIFVGMVTPIFVPLILAVVDVSPGAIPVSHPSCVIEHLLALTPHTTPDCVPRIVGVSFTLSLTYTSASDGLTCMLIGSEAVTVTVSSLQTVGRSTRYTTNFAVPGVTPDIVVPLTETTPPMLSRILIAILELLCDVVAVTL